MKKLFFLILLTTFCTHSIFAQRSQRAKKLGKKQIAAFLGNWKSESKHKQYITIKSIKSRTSNSSNKVLVQFRKSPKSKPYLVKKTRIRLNRSNAIISFSGNGKSNNYILDIRNKKLAVTSHGTRKGKPYRNTKFYKKVLKKGKVRRATRR